MPPKPRWLLAIPDAISQLEKLDRTLLTRRDIERLFGVSTARAATLMQTFGAEMTGYQRTLPRTKLLRQLRKHRALGSVPTVKQHLAAIRMLGDWLVVNQVLPVNPAAAVRGPKHVVTKGATPVLSPSEARKLLETIDTDTLAGLRDRALLSVMLYSFARVSAVLGMRRQDYFGQGSRGWFRLHEKDGKRHDVPAHHRAAAALDSYVETAGLDEPKAALFQSVDPAGRRLTGRVLERRLVLAMIKAACRSRGGPAFDVLPHVPSDGDHGVLVKRGDAGARAADRGARVNPRRRGLRGVTEGIAGRVAQTAVGRPCSSWSPSSARAPADRPQIWSATLTAGVSMHLTKASHRESIASMPRRNTLLVRSPPPDLTLAEILSHFPTDEKARQYLEAVRWLDGRYCPHCGNADQTRIHAITANKPKKVRAGLYECGACRDQFTVTVGTVFHGSKVPLRKWLAAFYLLCSSKKRFSALQLQGALQLGSYRTAWFMLHRIRYALGG